MAYRNGVVRRTTITFTGGEISVGRPEGTYQPKPRNFVLTIRPAPPARQVLLDGSPLPSLSAAATGRGWRREGDSALVRYADDGRAHQVQMR